MRNSAAKRAFGFSTLRVGMDPLVVNGSISKFVNCSWVIVCQPDVPNSLPK